MYKLESNKFWRIFKKTLSLVLVLTFSSYVLPVKSFASESTNYRVSTFAFTSSGQEGAGTTYELNHNTFGESVNGVLESANTKAKSGFLHTIIKDEDETAEPPPQGTDRLAESANFRQASFLLSIANADSASANFNIPLACVGEPVGGVLEGYYNRTSCGHIYTVLGNPPILIQDIPLQSWQINTSKNNALCLDDYFIDPDGDSLTFVVDGNANIVITIDPFTHYVSFSQSAGFVGSEDIIITAIDAQRNQTSSHPITLNVFNTGTAVNNPPLLEYIFDITAKEGSLIEIAPFAADPDGDFITYSFSAPFNSAGQWQTDYESAGSYNVTITASDGVLTDTQEIKVTVLNVNRKPTLNYIAALEGPENQLLTITPSAVDPDNDALTFSFSPPFNAQGQWLPAYYDSGERIVTVTVSDGALSDSQDVSVNITNVNTTPTVHISLDRINASVDEEISFIVTASDADGDPLTLILQKDGSQFYSGSIYEFYVGAASFSSLGVHTITAIVDDGHGGNAQNAVNVEIIEPQSLWNKILPLLGDFNGDGLVDIGTYNRLSGRWAAALSNFDGFGSITEWLTDFGASTDWQYVNGDFNGDGKTDIAIFNQSNGQWRVGASDGASFIDRGLWSTFSGASSDSLPLTGDFNGDGISDVGIYNKSNGEVRCALSDKNSFNSAINWLNGFAYSAEAKTFSGDFNGDGLTDLGVFNDGSWSFAVSDGRRFIVKSEWSRSFGAGKTPVISDFNNDGLTDIGVFSKDSGNWQIYHSTGDGWTSAGDWLNSFGQGEYNTVYALDFNGDGLTDAAVFDNSNFMWQRLAAQGEVSDLLQKLTNSLGGSTEITYKPSVYYDNTGDDNQCDLPFAMQTVCAVQQGDGRDNFYQTKYFYANGFYAPEERETRGFGYVKVEDSEGNISETYFYQDDIFKGLPYKTQISDSYGGLYLTTEKFYDYTNPHTGCTFAYLSEEEVSAYEGQITPRTVRTTYEYDDYGNPTKVTNLGDINIAGDEKESSVEYVYNLDLWLLGLPCRTYLTDSDSGGEILSQNWLYYDNKANYTDTPIKGNLTKEEFWLASPDKSNPVIQNSYDDYGNVLTTTDARGNVSTVTYDIVSHTYPLKVTNQLGHTIQNTYDFKTGQILTTTDPNNQTTRNEYDELGRIIQTFGPNDAPAYPSAWYEYDLSVNPAKVTAYVREEYNTDDPNKIRASYTFIDGLGRTIQTKTEADEPTEQIVSGIVTFNSRGETKHKYLPYFTDKSAEYNSPDFIQPKAAYEYDLLGRVVRQINPDGTYQSVEYSPGIVAATDANGHSIRKHQDAYGQTIKVEEFNHGRIYTTAYEYALQGNLVKTTDDHGNVTAISYDSLGRKTSMDDPDMGHWSYDYDTGGNLIKQTDAKGQTIEFEYDELNRLTKKWGLSPQGTVPIFSVEYLYGDPEKPNCVGRLSKITDQSGQTEFFYDNLGREIKTIKTINSLSYTVQRGYDALDRLKSLTYPDGEILTYTYSASGGIKTVIGNETYVSNVHYTAAGQMSLIDYGNGTHTDYVYNSQNLRLKQLTTNDGVLQDLSYQFDNVGNITAISDNCHTATQGFSYDDLNRLTLAIGQTYGSKTYRYDSIGNILEKDGLTYIYGENAAGPHAVTSLQGDLPPSLRGAEGDEAISITYDPNGNMFSKGEQTFTYDIENRLIATTSSLREDEVGETISFELTLSPGWNFISLPFIPSPQGGEGQGEGVLITDIFSNLNFGTDYDQFSQYNPETLDFDNYNNTSYNQFDTLEYAKGYLVYIPNSGDVNLTITGQPANSQTRQLKSGWNLIGTPSTEEITVSEALNNLEQGIDYDKIVRYNKTTQLFENLSSQDLLKPGEAYYLYCLKDTTWNTPSAKQTTKFAYDGDGGRVRKVVYTPSLRGTEGAEAISTTYIGSLYETSLQGEAETISTTKHIFLGSTRIATVSLREGEADEAISYYHSDHLGSSSVITNQDGKFIQHLEYLPFGQTQVSIGTDTVHHKFTGKELDSSTGLYYYGARYYDAQLGRFITADTIVQAPYDPQTLNRYSYCNNNPINYVDPTGHGWFKKFFGKIFAAVIGVAATILSGGNVALGFAAFNMADAIVSGAQALYYGANPVKVLGAVALSFTLSAAIPFPNFANLGLQIGAAAVRGAAISTATQAAIQGGKGKYGSTAAWGGGMGGTAGFFSSQQFQNWQAGVGFRSDQGVKNRITGLYKQGNLQKAIDLTLRKYGSAALLEAKIASGEIDWRVGICYQVENVGDAWGGLVGAFNKFASNKMESTFYKTGMNAMWEFSANVPEGQRVDAIMYMNRYTGEVTSIYGIDQPVLIDPATTVTIPINVPSRSELMNGR